MNEFLKKLRLLLTKIEGFDKLVVTDEDLLKIHNESLTGYTQESIRDLLTKNAVFQSVHDKFVTEKLEAQKSDLTTKSDSLLTEANKKLELLKSSTPRPNSPEEIQKRIDVEKDPAELRFLKLELEAANTANINAQLTLKNEENDKSIASANLLSTLNTHIKDKEYINFDAKSFVQFGDKAIEEVDKFAATLNTNFEDTLNKKSMELYGTVLPPKGPNGEPPKAKMTIQQIEKDYPGAENFDKRNELYIENGH